MRKYVHPQAAIHELCYRRSTHQRARVYRTGRLENNLSDLSILTRDMIVAIREKNFFPFFLKYNSSDEVKAFGLKYKLRPVTLNVHKVVPTVNGRGPSIEAKPQTKKRAHKVNRQLFTLYKVLVDDFVFANHVDKSLMKELARRIRNRGRAAIVVSETINGATSPYNKISWDSGEVSSEIIKPSPEGAGFMNGGFVIKKEEWEY